MLIYLHERASEGGKKRIKSYNTQTGFVPDHKPCCHPEERSQRSGGMIIMDKWIFYFGYDIFFIFNHKYFILNIKTNYALCKIKRLLGFLVPDELI